MKIGLEPVVGTEEEAARVDAILRRDLDLSGQFKLVDPASPPTTAVDDLDAPLSDDVWKPGATEAVVRVSASASDGGNMDVVAIVFLADDRERPAFERRFSAPLSDFRLTTHRLSDKLIGALTGYDGPFVSRLVFVRTVGGTRRVYAIDPDGHHLEAISPKNHLAVSPTIGPEDEIYWAGSVDRGAYRVYRASSPAPLTITPPGSVYGLTFSWDRSRAAVSIAVGETVTLFVGDAALTDLKPASKLPMALHPAFSDAGQLAYAGSKKDRQRVYVDGKAVSVAGRVAAAPDFCRHPDGTRLVYTTGADDRSEIVVADARGREPTTVMAGRGASRYPACSPDGRLVAFFSTRKGGQGPGLYVMRIDGRRVRKIADVTGDSLRWARLRPPLPL